MVETKPHQPVEPQPAQPEPVKSLQLPSVAAGFDFVSFFMAVFVTALIVTGVLFGYRYLVLQRTLDEQAQQIAHLNGELSQPDMQALERKLTEIAGGIDKIGPILNDPVRYGELFWTLRKVTEKSVRWNSLGFNESSVLSLTGEAAGWGNVARQIAAMKQNEKFSNVELASASVQDSESGVVVSFSMTMNVNTEKLIPPQ